MMNGPWKFLTAPKILPLLDLPAKFKRSKLLAARKVHGMLANARKDHSSPLLLVPSIFMLKSPFPRKLNNVSVGMYVYTPAIEHVV